MLYFHALVHRVIHSMGILRTAFRKLLSHELGVVGGELLALSDRNADLTLQIETLTERFDRLQNRVGMRINRAAARGEAPPPPTEFDALLAAEKQPGRPNGAGPLPGGWRDMM